MSVPVKMIFTAVFCAASVGLMALAPPAVAQQKTVKQCNDEWVAERAAIQASGKTKPMFLAECRGLPVPARTPGTAALAQGQYATESEARASCPSATDVLGYRPRGQKDRFRCKNSRVRRTWQTCRHSAVS